MPRVPTYDNFQTSPNVLQGQVAAPKPINAMPEQLQQLGQGMQQAGSSMGKIALDMQQQANQVRVDDAINQAKQAALDLTFSKDVGYTNLLGKSALDRASGKPLADEYTDNLREKMRSINDTLGNDAQKAQFRAQTQDLVGNFWADAVRHESNQFRAFNVSTQEARIDNQNRTIALKYQDPVAVDEAVKSIQAATYELARMQGKSAEWVEAQVVKATSNAHTTAIMSALQDGNGAYAQAYLGKYASQMDPNDILRTRGLVTDQVDSQYATTAVQGVMQGVTQQYNTSDADRAFNIAINTESGGRQFGANGQPITSSKGAIGIAQVMPDTAPEAAKLAGLPWDENRYKTDPQYNAALGRAYFGKQLQDNGGDLRMAYAAYNAGPGALKKAQDEATKNQGTDWLQYLPKETQDYVAKNMSAYAAGKGANQRPSLNQVMQQVQATVGTDNPKRLKLAQDEAKRQYDLMTNEAKQRDADATMNAMRELEANGGNFAGLSLNARAALPPDKVPTLMDYAARIAKGDDTTSPALYQKLATDKNYLMNMSDSEFYALRGQLSQSDFKKFSDERGRLLAAAGKGGSKTANPAETLNTGAINSVLNDRLSSLKIDPTPKDGSADAARIGVLRKFVRESILNEQQITGKMMTDAEVGRHIDGLFAKSVSLKGWFSSTNVRMLGMNASDVPSDIKDKLRADFKALGIDNPTDADLLGAYWQTSALQ